MAKIGNLASRILVAVFAAPLLTVLFYLDSPTYTWGFIFLASIVAMDELYRMTLPDPRDRLASLICGGVAMAAFYWLSPDLLRAATGNAALAASGGTITLVLTVLPIGIYYLFRFGDMTSAAARVAHSITGIVYVGLLFQFIPLIKRDFGPAGGDVIVLVLMVAWVGDTGAYFAGRYLGKRKLYVAVSPKKTWAGAVGGVAASALAGAATKIGLSALHQAPSLMHELTWLDIFILAVPGAILGQIGDLFESLIKRSTGIKDSSSLLPGHGGVLDRVDAVLFLAPYVYLYLIIRGALL
ncbi:MAG TPA: phosphatidate cytidylyltransferase [Haliangium sp.]|nr:phosphatidate cytidylyltransferase [Haliangium sp.]